jgi:hypothetical protein
VPDLGFCNDRQQLQLSGLLAAALFRVLWWQCVVCVRGGVVHLLVLLVVEGPTQLYAAGRVTSCLVVHCIYFPSALPFVSALAVRVLQVGATIYGYS